MVPNLSEKRPVILIIDDDEVNRKVLEMLLKHEKVELLLAETGDEGLDLALKQIPNLILLDLVMPSENGLDVLKKFKNNPDLKNIPVLIFTIVNQETTRNKAFELGASDYLTKPFDMRQVLEEIRKWLNLSSHP